MKKIALVFGSLFVLPAFAGSFLKAQSFPKTFQDLSFTSRMEFLAEDYEMYKPEYDDDGFCIKGCAYPGLHITREQEIYEQNTEAALQNITNQQAQQNPTQNLPVDTQTIVNTVTNTPPQAPSTTSTAPTCTDRNTAIPVGQQSPFGKPLKGSPRISSPFGPRGKSFHAGTDFAVPVGTSVYTPADATVVRLINGGACGIGLRLKHNDGLQTVYCHLSKQLVSAGQKVGAGCKVAESGNTGHSTGPHLHYEIRDSSGPLKPDRFFQK